MCSSYDEVDYGTKFSGSSLAWNKAGVIAWFRKYGKITIVPIGIAQEGFISNCILVAPFNTEHGHAGLGHL